MKELQGKVAFVTGGASGIGRGMASVFLKAGMRVVIADVRTDRLRKTESILREISSGILAVETDVTSLESIQRAAEKAEAAFGNVHVLCNDAGVGFGGAFLNASTEQWQRVLDINLWGAIRGVQVFLAQDARPRRGRSHREYGLDHGHVRTARTSGPRRSGVSRPY